MGWGSGDYRASGVEGLELEGSASFGLGRLEYRVFLGVLRRVMKNMNTLKNVNNISLVALILLT